jgi:hypothetical protein
VGANNRVLAKGRGKDKRRHWQRDRHITPCRTIYRCMKERKVSVKDRETSHPFTGTVDPAPVAPCHDDNPPSRGCDPV